MLQVAVFSDIHGNYHAFQECLEIALNRNVDGFIFLGDYLGEFAYPRRTLELIYDLKNKYNCYFIRGNKEDYWLNMHQGVNCEWKDGNSSIYAMLYNYSNLTEQDFNFFSCLPICDCFCMDGASAITFCHGSPRNNREKLFSKDIDIDDILNECESTYLLCGHSHIQQRMERNGKVIINPGAVGVALHGNGGNAEFMIMTSDKTEWIPEFFCVDYDKESTIRELHESGLYEKTPYWCQITEHLIKTGEVSHGTVLTEAYRLCEAERSECKWYNIPDKYWEMALNNLF